MSEPSNEKRPPTPCARIAGIAIAIVLLIVGPSAPQLVAAEESKARVQVLPLRRNGSVPDAEVDASGNVHVAFYSEGDVYYTRSSDKGESFSAPLRINSEPGFAMGGAFRGPDLAIGKGGRIHVVWFNAGYQQKRPKNEWGVMYSRLAPDAKKFERSRNLNARPSDNFSLAADGEGRVAAIWMANGIFATISNDGGNSFASALDLKVDPCECCGSRAVYQAGKDLVVLYRDKADGDRDTFVARLPDGGKSFRSVKISQTPWAIESCPMTGSFLQQTKKGLIAGWETKGEVFFARLGDLGKRLPAGEIRASRRGRYPVVLEASDGVCLVAWKNGRKLEWQLFDGANRPIGDGGSMACSSGDRPAGAVMEEGKFLLFP